MTEYLSKNNETLSEIRERDLETYFQQAFEATTKSYDLPKEEREEVTYLPFEEKFNYSTLINIEETISNSKGDKPYAYIDILKKTLKETLIKGSQETKSNLLYTFQDLKLFHTEKALEELTNKYDDNLNLANLLDTKNKFLALNVFANHSNVATNILNNSQNLFNLSKKDLEDNSIISHANKLIESDKIGLKDKVSIIKSLSEKKNGLYNETNTFKILQTYVEDSSIYDNKVMDIKEIFNNFHKNDVKIKNEDFENVVRYLPNGKEMEEIFYEQIKNSKNNEAASTSYGRNFSAQNSLSKAKQMIALDNIHTALKNKNSSITTRQVMDLIENRQNNINYKEDLNHLELDDKLSILTMYSLKDKNKLVLATEILKKDSNILKKSPQKIASLLRTITEAKEKPFAEIKAFSKALSTFSAETKKYAKEIEENVNSFKKSEKTREAFGAEEEKYKTIGNILNSIGNTYSQYEYTNKNCYKSKGYSQADFEQIVSNVLEGKEPQSLEAHKSGLFSGKDTKEAISTHLNPSLEIFSNEIAKLKPFAEDLKQYSGNIVKNNKTINEMFTKSNDAYVAKKEVKNGDGILRYQAPEYESFLQEYNKLNLFETIDSITAETNKKEKELKATADYNLERYLGVTSEEKSGAVKADEIAEKTIETNKKRKETAKKEKLDHLKSSLKQKAQEDLKERDVMTRPNPNNSSELPEGKKILPDNKVLKALKEIKALEKGNSK